ncbi:translation initiation factor IF-2 [Phormidium sp. CLA17]|uniref:translation initiation factor IF-2 n=1 Tax=Leptolyngbya sp. Cla-17 TaxID=2803751 RepID=UPI001492E024|nr:translation initiation factor IF-2 [Leptolyngbya sp. Cla-17]MBM0741852.1 translation initiation factor IF-2 [Leptolyngbya sp. Cla-17]
MNSGKIRIYEISRELNLDNKDILAICEQLSISVKSHSSTITDSEAERIHTAAEKYTATHSSSVKPVTRPANNSSAAEPKQRVSVPVQKKQQIVAIKSVTRSPNVEAPTPPTYKPSPIETGSLAPTQSSPKPVELGRPERAIASDETLVKPSEKVVTSTSLDTKAVSLDIEVKELPSPQVDVSPQAFTASPEEDTAATLASPPPRPEAVTPSAPRNSLVPNTSSRPILKRVRVEEPASATETADGVNRQPSTGARSVKPPAKSSAPNAKPTMPARQLVGKPAEGKPIPRPQQQTIVELRRPKPVRPDADSTSTEGRMPGAMDDLVRPELRVNRPTRTPPMGDVAVGADPLLQPKPALPRTVKKGKDWQDGEDEESQLKSPKVGTKAKRRVQPDLDAEEEDLDTLLEGEDGEDGTGGNQVSLSLVRPAKPKGMRQAPTKAPIAITQKPKKGGSGSRDRRDRREEVKVEKPTNITLLGSLTVQELAAKMETPETDIIRALFMKGIMATVTQTLDIETATMVALELGVEAEVGVRQAAATKVIEMLDVGDLESLQRRPPVVTIMGHVDHGKTSLLDSIRKTKVAQGEAGGITQHIGAYHVDVEHNGEMQKVVFLDTPGHEAFTAMRARGARVTDVAILVVAADDGVQPQTIEAISHAKAAEVPIVIAINKIDKEGAQPERVKQELTEYGLVPEEWGGDTIMVPVSALNGDNLDTLLEMILLVTEIEELSANPDRVAKGTVIEAHLDKAKGPVATLLVQNGTLRVGDVLVAGSSFGKVRAMVDDRGQRVKVAGPSFAVEVLGLADVPAAGDEFDVFADEKEARAVSSDRSDEQRQSRLLAAMSSRRVSLNTLSARAQEGELKELNLVLKADVQGSVEAILSSLKQLPQNEVQVRVLYAAPGEISETDIDLAAASSAVIIGFNTTLATGARQAADRLGVDVRDYNIIYNLLDDIQGAMEGLLDPELVEEPLGQVEVRAVFPVGRGQVAGCYVQSGKIVRNCKVRIRRNNNVVFEGSLDSLKRMKEDVKEVNTAFECGIGIDNFNSWEMGDVIEAYRMISKRRTLSKT